MLNNNTICAIATASGGAIGIIRISGPEAISIADKIFCPIGSNLSLSQRKAYTLAFGNIVNAEKEVVDEVLCGDFLPRIVLRAQPGNDVANAERLSACRPRRVHTTCIPQWQDGSIAGRGSCRPYKLHKQSHSRYGT